MRNFLQNLNIVACVGVWSEGETLKYTFDNLLGIADQICVLMDKPDKITETIVNNYANRYEGRFVVGKSTVPPLRDPNHVRRRAKVYASQLGEEKLALVKSVHEKRKIDILLSPDSDEVFTDTFPEVLIKFWESEYDNLRLRPITVYDDLYTIIDKGMAPHYRAYKYRDDMHYTPWRYYDFFHPFKEENTYPKAHCSFVHLNQLEVNRERRDKIGAPRLADVSPEAKLRPIRKMAWELTEDEYLKLLKNPLFATLEEYEKLPK